MVQYIDDKLYTSDKGFGLMRAILFFFNDSCPASKDTENQIEYISKYFSPQLGLPIYKMSVKDQQSMSYMQKYGVESTPTIVVIDGDRVVGKFNKACSAQDIMSVFGIKLPQG